MRLLCLCLTLVALPAHAEFLISSAILEFTVDGPRQQDIDVIGHGSESDYLVSEISEILHPGSPNEQRRLVTDTDSRLLVTPDKTVLAPGSRKILRFVLLAEPDAQEHIYRVAVKPVIKGVEGQSKLGLKVLVGYEVLVILRPAAPVPQYKAKREGKTLVVSNGGNTNVLFQNGQQCVPDCRLSPVERVYPGQTARIALKHDAPVRYSVWNGQETVEKSF